MLDYFGHLVYCQLPAAHDGPCQGGTLHWTFNLGEGVRIVKE
jgi:hypothetical protein